MADAVSAAPMRLDYTAVTWVPASPEQKRRRGFDQGRILARGVGRQLQIPTRSLLRRSGAPQTGQSRAERLLGPDLYARRRTQGAVLVVDDVVTTGASLRRAAMVLVQSGAHRVDAVVFAATAPHRANQFPIPHVTPG
ncbi:MAG: phosphoribosyltransferase family protein [Acidimicrobiales bacterium]